MLVTGLRDLCLPGLSVGPCQGEIDTPETYKCLQTDGAVEFWPPELGFEQRAAAEARFVSPPILGPQHRLQLSF